MRRCRLSALGSMMAAIACTVLSLAAPARVEAQTAERRERQQGSGGDQALRGLGHHRLQVRKFDEFTFSPDRSSRRRRRAGPRWCRRRCSGSKGSTRAWSMSAPKDDRRSKWCATTSRSWRRPASRSVYQCARAECGGNEGGSHRSAALHDGEPARELSARGLRTPARPGDGIRVQRRERRPAARREAHGRRRRRLDLHLRRDRRFRHAQGDASATRSSSSTSSRARPWTRTW